METETIDLQAADSARFAQLLDDMQFNFYRRCRAHRPDAPLSYFSGLGFWTADDVLRFENRYRRESK